MKIKNWTPEELAEWARMLPGSSLMNCHNKIKIWGEIHVDNSESKHPPEGEEEEKHVIEITENL